MHRLTTLALLGLLFITPLGQAFPIGDGTKILYLGTPATFTFNTGGTTDIGCIEFDANHAPRLDGVILDIPDGNWTITSYAPGAWTITANLASPTTFHLRGPQSYYTTSGLVPYGNINVMGIGTTTYDLSAGAHTISVQGHGGSPIVECRSGLFGGDGISPGVASVNAAVQSGAQIVLYLIFVGITLSVIAGVIFILKRG